MRRNTKGKKKNQSINQPNQTIKGTNRAPSISIYQPSPLDFTECSPPLISHVYLAFSPPLQKKEKE
jgi:hypothetical protein